MQRKAKCLFQDVHILWLQARPRTSASGCSAVASCGGHVEYNDRLGAMRTCRCWCVRRRSSQLVLLWHFMQKLAVVEQHGYSLACLTARPKPTRLRGTMLHRSLQSSSSTSQNRNAERAMNFVRPSRSSFGGFCRPAKPLSAKARSALLATHSHFDYLPSSASQQGPLRPDADVIGARMSRVLSYAPLTTLR